MKAPSSVEEGIQIPGYESITIPAGTADVSVELMNPEENNVYLRFLSIFRKRTRLFIPPR